MLSQSRSSGSLTASAAAAGRFDSSGIYISSSRYATTHYYDTGLLADDGLARKSEDNEHGALMFRIISYSLNLCCNSIEVAGY